MKPGECGFKSNIERATEEESAALFDQAVKVLQNTLQVFTKADLPQESHFFGLRASDRQLGSKSEPDHSYVRVDDHRPGTRKDRVVLGWNRDSGCSR
jgi:hypothetical protein